MTAAAAACTGDPADSDKGAADGLAFVASDKAAKPTYRFTGELPSALQPLRPVRQWVTWDYVWNSRKEKWDKPPLSAHTGRAASINNPANLGTFDEAANTARRLDLAGIGFVLKPDDNLTGIDLDDCINDAGSLLKLAAEIVEYGETYAEVSPSGEGVRLFALGKIDSVVKNDALGIEVYDKGRYLTVTGRQLLGTPDHIAEAPRTIARLKEAHAAASRRAAASRPNGDARERKVDGGDFFAGVNAAACSNLDAWVPALHPTARKEATGAWRVTSRALGRNLEEDLAYHPGGLRDFGEEVGLTAVDAVARYGEAADAKEAALWLCQKLGIEPASLGWKRRSRAKPERSTGETPDDNKIIEELSALSIVAYGRRRTVEAKKLGISVTALDKAVEEHQRQDRADGVDDERAKSASALLVQLARKQYDFGISDAGEAFGVPRSGPKIVQTLRGGRMSLRHELSRAYFQTTGRVATQQALTDALNVIEGEAQQMEPQTLHLRVAWDEGVLWLDLGDTTGRTIRIDGSGWRIEARPPVLFKRTALTAALPEPEPCDTLDDLWRWLNVAEHDKPLTLALLISYLFPGIPHPIALLAGEQGTGKTTAAKVLAMVVDPSPVPSRKPPKDTDAWVTAAIASWVVGLDNLSTIPAWLSDALCRTVTGEGDVRRKLYTDTDVTVLAFKRCVILNGIDLGVLRGDLSERIVHLELTAIPEQGRKTETELWGGWKTAHPRILGAVLRMTAGLMNRLSLVALARKPRMADFACILACVDEMLGTAGLPRYLQMQGELAADTLSSDAFVTTIAALVGTAAPGRPKGTFKGTAAELLKALPCQHKPPPGWPATPRMATQHLHRMAPLMRQAGWRVDRSRGRTNATVWCLEAPEELDRF